MDPFRVFENLTPMELRCVPLRDRRGARVLVFIAKMTYEVRPDGAVGVAIASAPVRLHGEPTSGSPGASLRYPSDLVDEKPGTDVVLVGAAHPAQPAATFADVTLRVLGGVGLRVDKTLRVHGTRVYYESPLGVVPGPAAALRPTALTWENAYGGPRRPEAPRDGDARNPAGFGAVTQRSKLVGQAAPAIEDRAARGAAPAGFGPVQPSWEPRNALAGTYDAAWARDRAPLRAVDFDVRHNACAPDGQWCDPPLDGDEAVEVLGVRPGGAALRFRLPRYRPTFRCVVGGVGVDLETHLDTVIIDADVDARDAQLAVAAPRAPIARVELVWRASIVAPKKSEQLEKVVVRGEGQLAADLLEDLGVRLRAADAVEAG